MAVAVLDVGKTSIKLSAVEPHGEVLETLSALNTPVEGALYPIADYPRIEQFLLDGLNDFQKRHRLTDFIASTHGSTGVLLNGDGSTTPLPDYEVSVPDDVERRYASIADTFGERGGGISRGASHLAKQLFWLKTSFPEIFAKAAALLPGPQYWAWRLSGVTAIDITSLAAQSHLWNAQDGEFAPIVARQSWTALMPPLRPSSDILGFLKPSIAGKLALMGDLRVRCGVHDSSANFYRYEAQGLRDITLLSMGTWLVGLTDALPFPCIDGSVDISLQVSAAGRRMAGVRSMAGREFELLSRGFRGQAPRALVETLIRTRTFALPSFVNRDGIVPNSSGRGRIVGPSPRNESEHAALALLYVVLLADLSLDRLQSQGTVVLDGSATSHALFPSLLAALRPGQKLLVADGAYGTAAGAANLTLSPEDPRPKLSLNAACAEADLPIARYRREWREMVVQIQNEGENACPEKLAVI
jgi:sugar (pentulose or hexulose) kinase